GPSRPKSEDGSAQIPPQSARRSESPPSVPGGIPSGGRGKTLRSRFPDAQRWPPKSPSPDKNRTRFAPASEPAPSAPSTARPIPTALREGPSGAALPPDKPGRSQRGPPAPDGGAHCRPPTGANGATGRSGAPFVHR